MSKRKWYSKAFYLAIALALAVSLAGMTAVSADPAKESEWDDVSTPSGDGLVVFFTGADILDFDIGPDGEVIYAVVLTVDGCTINSDTYTAGSTILLKSEDSGATWSDITGELPTGFGDLILVSVAPDNADFVVVATDNEVYGSNEGGDDFEDTGFPEKADPILCLDVSCEVDDDEWNIAVGTDAGKVWRFVAGGYWGGYWKDATDTATYPGWLPSTKVTSVAFSPNFDGDETILAVTSGFTPPYELGHVGAGTAEWSTEQNNTDGGSYSVELGVTDFVGGLMPDWGWVNVYTPPTPLSELTSNPTFFARGVIAANSGEQVGPGPTDWNHGPFLNILLDTDGDFTTVESKLEGGIVKAVSGETYDSSAFVEVESYYWGDYEGQLLYSEGDVINERLAIPFADAKTRLGTLYPDTTFTVVGVHIQLGNTWFVNPNQVVYVDDITINDVTYPLEPATYLQTGRWDTTKEWNEEASPLNVKAVKIADGAAVSSGIAIPSDYDGFDSSLRKVFAYVNTVDKGYLQRVDSSKVYPCPGRKFGFCPNANGTDLFASLAYHGTGIDGKFMLGAKDSTQVWRAEDLDFCCPEWSTASKKPTGDTDTLVAFTPDGKKGYAATKGIESAFSVSLDGNGQYWNQISLIDTNIDSLSDVAVSADCGTTLLFSVNDGGCSSVWFKAADLPEATEYDDVWLREWCGELEEGNGLIRLAPEETERVFTVYLVDQGTDNVWHNDSSGLTKWIDRHCTRIGEITDLAVESESIIYAIGGDDVSKSTDNGRRWASTVDTKVEEGHTIAVLGDYVLVGGEDGEVSYSDDAGDGFTALDDAGKTKVHVAFDSYFGDNGVVYAASDSIYRCSDLEEGEWTNFKSNYGPDGEADTGDDIGLFYGIALDNAGGNPMTDEDTGGVLYAVYEDGMARVLGAADSKAEDYLHNGLPTEETVVTSEFTAEPSALKICGCLTEDSNSLLWAINLAEREDLGPSSQYDLEDGKNNLFVYEDCLSKAGVELSKVKDEAVIAADPCECWNDKFVLNWDDLCNSSTYELQIALDEDFDFIVKPDEGLVVLSSVDDEYLLIPDETLDCNETYYWRVRVIKADSDAEVIRSWWSDAWSFTVQAGPMAAIQLTAPDSGATDVAIEGVAFTWTSVAAATSYDFALMDAAGNVISSETGLTGTAYAYPETLSYDTPYTWKVTTMKNGSVLSESSLSTFRTVPAGVFACPQCGLSFPTGEALKTHIAEAHPAAVPTTPAWVWVVIGLGAVLVITILVLIFRTRRI